MSTSAGVAGDRFLLLNGVPITGAVPPVSAFLESTSGSLRLVQHAETIQAPNPHKEHLKTWSEIAWDVKQFEGTGLITAQIQAAIVERMGKDGYQIGLSSATKRCLMDPGS